MILRQLNLINFRNYKKLTLNFNSKINIIIGKNGHGKTNILEAIYLLGLTKSHRAVQESDLVHKNSEFSSIVGIAQDNTFKTKFKILLSNNSKILEINDTIIKRNSDYISKLNIIIFYPEELELIKGSPLFRRNYFNIEISQLYSKYLKVQSDYNKLLKMRNDYLKQQARHINVDLSYFEVLTNHLVEKAIVIYKMRQKFVEKINLYIDNIFFDITGLKGLKLSFVSSINDLSSDDSIRKEFYEKLGKNSDYETRIGMTLTGPHRDDFEFMLDEVNLKNFGSQGQQRCAVIALKLAELEIFKQYKDTAPILLLDDVFSELDEDKKNGLLKYIDGSIQTIITSTDLNNINERIVKKAKIILIKNGKKQRKEKVIEDGK
jgi:DNA replication and repair protein RecF